MCPPPKDRKSYPFYYGSLDGNISLDNKDDAINRKMIEKKMKDALDRNDENEKDRVALSNEITSEIKPLERDQKQAFSEVPNFKHEHDFDKELEESHSSKRIKRDIKMERHFAHHDYHDHSCDQQVQFCSSLKDMKHKSNRGGVSVPFPLKLHRMLSQVGNEDLDDIVSWQTHGRCFVAHRPKDFVEFVMPK